MLDAKRRVTLPATFRGESGRRVVVVASPDVVMVVADRKAAREARHLLQEGALQRKFRALDDWARLLVGTGLEELGSPEIERRIGKAMRRAPARSRPGA